MVNVTEISTLLYRKMNGILGHEESVTLLREAAEVLELLPNRGDFRWRMSGSMKEGFNMKGSDIDLMLPLPRHHVVFDPLHVQFYRDKRETFFVSENHETRPGYVLLRLLNRQGLTNLQTLRSFIYRNGMIYVSSFIFKQDCINTKYIEKDISSHGPCTAVSFCDGVTYDFAMGFSSKHWPPQANSWIQRSKRQCWPTDEILSEIVQEGCLFVPVGVSDSHLQHLEWRLSFSLAEVKLVRGMNHCQFLVYGLLKIFLREVLNTGQFQNDLVLCSYFMKTAVFWEIQMNDSLDWTAENYLICFWKCFKRLIKWVYQGYCPNFFVSENNMFINKITGVVQSKLLCHMLKLYEVGLLCLKECPSIRETIVNTCISSEQFRIEMNSIPMAFTTFDFDLSLCGISQLSVGFKECNKTDHKKYLHFLVSLLKSNISFTQSFMVYSNLLTFCQGLALASCYCLSPGHYVQKDSPRMNKRAYGEKQKHFNILKSAVRVGFVSDMLHLALYYYIHGRYRLSLYTLENVKPKLCRTHLLYIKPLGNSVSYEHAMKGKSIGTKIKESMVRDVCIPSQTNFKELKLELFVCGRTEQKCLRMSPFGFFYFLLYLCHYRLDITPNVCLDCFEAFVVVDDDRYSHKYHKDIHWEMLGICQQISGRLQEAIVSFKKCFRMRGFNRIQTAAFHRIRVLESQDNGY